MATIESHKEKKVWFSCSHYFTSNTEKPKILQWIYGMLGVGSVRKIGQHTIGSLKINKHVRRVEYCSTIYWGKVLQVRLALEIFQPLLNRKKIFFALLD